MKKFSIGNYNPILKICETSWIEIIESDSLSESDDRNNNNNNNNEYEDSRDLNSFMRIVSYKGNRKRYGNKRYEKLVLNENNATKQEKSLKQGRYCGTLFNFLSSYYSTRKHLTIRYVTLNVEKSNDLFEFEVSFHLPQSLSPHLFSKQKFKLSNMNLKRKKNYNI